MDLFGIVGRALGLFWWVIKTAAPYVWRGAMELVKTAGITLVALLKTIWNESKVMATLWTAELVHNEPTMHQHDHIIWHVMRIAGIITLVIGWVILSFITVWIVRAII